MRIDVGRRLVPISTLGVAGLCVMIVFGIGLFAFGAYVAHLKNDASSLLSEAVEIARALPSGRSAKDAAHEVAARFIQPALLVVFIDRSSRVTVLRAEGRTHSTRASVIVRSADDRRLPEADGVVARLALGLATTFGLGALHAHGGRLDVTVDANEPRFVEDVREFIPAFLIALALALGVAAAVARILTRGALRPLTEVTRALERFSAGDFTAEFIENNGNKQLRALATAYNGAVEQVERAFAERAYANAVMRQFIADGGHQMRTPLTVIRGFLGILRNSGGTMERAEIDHILESMMAQTLLMGSMIEKLILLEHWENSTPPTIEPVDLSALCRNVVSPFALAHPERALCIRGAEGAIAFTDAGEIAHAISNIVENAIKYTAGWIDVHISKSSSDVAIAVADCGPGMSEAERTRAFDRFYRGRQREIRGSGLGLAIAKRAVERCGGTIDLESSEKNGTRITIRFGTVKETT